MRCTVLVAAVSEHNWAVPCNWLYHGFVFGFVRPRSRYQCQGFPNMPFVKCLSGFAKVPYQVPPWSLPNAPRMPQNKCFPGCAERPCQGQPLFPENENVPVTRAEGTFECKARLKNADNGSCHSVSCSSLVLTISGEQYALWCSLVFDRDFPRSNRVAPSKQAESVDRDLICHPLRPAVDPILTPNHPCGCFACSLDNFCGDLFFKFAREMAGILVNFQWSPFPRKQSTKNLNNWGKKLSAKFGANWT